MANNKVKFGLKNVHYALLTVSEDGAVSFSTPVPIPGAVSMSLSPQGETETFYADDIAYYVSTANNGYQGDLEIALLPDSFRTDVLREVEDETDHVLVEKSTAEPQPFALLYQFTGDQQASLRVLYNCAAARPSEASSTIKNTKTPTTDTLSLTASPLANGNIKAKTTADTPDEIKKNWFKSVWQPGAAAAM
jgi:phi13 family phage major tail protein